MSTPPVDGLGRLPAGVREILDPEQPPNGCDHPLPPTI